MYYLPALLFHMQLLSLFLFLVGLVYPKPGAFAPILWPGPESVLNA